MVERLTYRRHNRYNTKSNKKRILRTPGGRLVYQHVQKKATGPKCGDCGKAIIGVPRLRPIEYRRLKKRVLRRLALRGLHAHACDARLLDRGAEMCQTGLGRKVVGREGADIVCEEKQKVQGLSVPRSRLELPLGRDAAVRTT
eukprot:CAMPEP_0117506698 /NCGR_PEP_ID=MMETSP0784-20121206/26042_1 /TAXON_ID=39447 /ORGANISM="" /LENGTH=142 /DNA_ID=CAMNT_0005302179 /DNA_START=98 /DNA_END=522 /DNA_ORIENTATION=-